MTDKTLLHAMGYMLGARHANVVYVEAIEGFIPILQPRDRELSPVNKEWVFLRIRLYDLWRGLLSREEE